MKHVKQSIIFIFSVMDSVKFYLLGSVTMLFFLYTIIGTNGNVDKIRSMAPDDIENNRGWVILREEGYQYASFGRHGGVVWYHVADKNNKSIQYKVRVSLWDGRLEYWYNEPEKLNRLNINYGELK